MILAHKIQINANKTQLKYFAQAAGTSRFVWNWALGEWNKQYQEGLKPNANALKKEFNAIKYEKFPWLKGMHRDSHSQPFANLNKAFNTFFKDIKAGKPAHAPVFKKKGKTNDSFYIANDKFKVIENTAILPVLGKVKLAEKLRFEGKVLSGVVSRTANKWYLSVQVEVPDIKAIKRRKSSNVVGVDLGLTTLATLSTGEKITAPKPLKRYKRRLKIRARAYSRRLKPTKKAKKPQTLNARKSAAILAKTHKRITNIRVDFCHKLTKKLCHENQVIVLEDLNVSGMTKNHHLAKAVVDASFGIIRKQVECKSLIYKNTLLLADPWYPSTKLCHVCKTHNPNVVLGVKTWTCTTCGTKHDRDANASKNLEDLAYLYALPDASTLVTKYVKSQ